MLSAKRKADGETVLAYFQTKAKGPFACPDCHEEVILKSGAGRANHFAHANPIACKFATGESNAHRSCKLEIFLALQKIPGVSNLALERPVGNVRPDVSATIRGSKVAIEVQISSLSTETIQQRTIEYAREGMFVLWLLQWTPDLDAPRYCPRPWEKWWHAVYFGRVYYWVEGLQVVPYHFDPSFITVPKQTWYSKDGKKMTSGGFSRRSKRYRAPVRAECSMSRMIFSQRNGIGGKVTASLSPQRSCSWIDNPSLNHPPRAFRKWALSVQVGCYPQSTR
jgi:competence protein CoiA